MQIFMVCRYMYININVNTSQKMHYIVKSSMQLWLLTCGKALHLQVITFYLEVNFYTFHFSRAQLVSWHTTFSDRGSVSDVCLPLKELLFQSWIRQRSPDVSTNTCRLGKCNLGVDLTTVVFWKQILNVFPMSISRLWKQKT